MEIRKPIHSFQDFNVYQLLFQLMSDVYKQILPKLPVEEKYDLTDQLRRSSKAPLSLLAEGFAKRYQTKQWRKYLDDCIGEINETIHHLTVASSLYFDDSLKEKIQSIISEYDHSARQIYKLKLAWKNYHQSD